MSAARKASKKKKLLRVTLTKSPIGQSYKQKRTVQALGLRRMHQAVEQRDTPTIRGMIAKVEHLVTVEEIE
jgi:large subunit ribosomal protein L30